MAGPAQARSNRATLVVYFPLLVLGTVTSLYLNGVFTREAMIRVGFLAPVYMAALWLGERLFRHSTDVAYRRFALLALVGIGLFGLFAR
jgi:hypothetical protein